MSTPNLFANAVKELSQDAFVVWLLQWADPKHKSANPALNELAQQFVRLCVQDEKLGDIVSVNAWRQQEHIDVFAVVNETHVLVIENKLFTTDHSDQLERYQEYVRENYEGKEHSFIFLTLGNIENSHKLNIKSTGYSIIDRGVLLSLLKDHASSSPIVNDFYRYVGDIEAQTQAWNDPEMLKSNNLTKEGFFIELEKCVKDSISISYVPNRSGGFKCFKTDKSWYESEKMSTGAFIQIESPFPGETRLVAKIQPFEGKYIDIDTMYWWLEEIIPFGEKHGVVFIKPDRFSTIGENRILAVVGNFEIYSKAGKVDFNRLAELIEKTETALKEFMESGVVS